MKFGILTYMTCLMVGILHAEDGPYKVSEIIEREGKFEFSDGSSIYTFSKDGTFRLNPVGMSGRMIGGRWSDKHGYFTIVGRWSWLNGMSRDDDYRQMKLSVTVWSKKKVELKSLNKDKVYSVYFHIDSLVKISEEEYRKNVKVEQKPRPTVR